MVLLYMSVSHTGLKPLRAGTVPLFSTVEKTVVFSTTHTGSRTQNIFSENSLN